MNNNLESELDMCPFIRTCNPDDESILEDYCICGDYESCESYLRYKLQKNQKGIEENGI